MVGQLIAMGMGMCVVPGRKSRLLLRLMRCLGMRMVHGVMLVFLTLPVFVRAILGPGLGGLGIIGLAIGSVSWRHSQYLRALLLKQSRYRSYEYRIDGIHHRTPFDLNDTIRDTLFCRSKTRLMLDNGENRRVNRDHSLPGLQGAKEMR